MYLLLLLAIFQYLIVVNTLANMKMIEPQGLAQMNPGQNSEAEIYRGFTYLTLSLPNFSLEYRSILIKING
jgi:hypothetical protein